MVTEEVRRQVLRNIIMDLKAGHHLAKATPMKWAALCGHPLGNILTGTDIRIEQIPALIHELKKEWH